MSPLCAPWADESDLCEPCDNYSLDYGTMADFLQEASELLFLASGQQFPGVCEVTVHPCSCSSLQDWSLTVNNGILTSAYAFNACGCSNTARCSCDSLSAIDLPHWPIIEVSEVVTTDDGILSPTAYEVRGSELVRLDGGKWPLCDDGFLVTYTWGTAPPLAGIRAAAILACELYMGCNQSAFEGQCRLPRNVVSVVRQGVSIAFKSAYFTPQVGKPIEFGIPELDTFLATSNPFGLIAPSVILSPDDPDLARLV